MPDATGTRQAASSGKSALAGTMRREQPAAGRRKKREASARIFKGSRTLTRDRRRLRRTV
jgi:hypothetical protein